MLSSKINKLFSIIIITIFIKQLKNMHFFFGLFILCMYFIKICIYFFWQKLISSLEIIYFCMKLFWRIKLNIMFL